MKKFFLFTFLFILLGGIITSIVLVSCKRKDSIGPQLEGTWKTDWNKELKKPLKKMEVNEGISFFTIPGQTERGNLECAFIGVVEYKGKNNKAPIEFFVTVPGTWIVSKKDHLILRYDLSKIDVMVSHEKTKFDVVGTIGDVAGDIFTGNWGGALNSVVGTVTNINADSKIDDEARKKLKEYFREFLGERNKDKITYKKVKIEDGRMTCDPGGMLSSKVIFYKTDDTPVHLINSLVNIEEAEKQEETTEIVENIDSMLIDVRQDIDSLLNIDVDSVLSTLL